SYVLAKVKQTTTNGIDSTFIGAKNAGMKTIWIQGISSFNRIFRISAYISIKRITERLVTLLFWSKKSLQSKRAL
ncbi:MAG: hypothetical protein MZU97_20875, partial [Bacillus subtilis]|nr:hypothetical protein [Bacillus subtilis]